MDYSAFEIELPPLAPVLLESMRAIGYSFESALADIIDNSISAEALDVRVRFLPYGDPYVAVLDDGTGMSTKASSRRCVMAARIQGSPLRLRPGTVWARSKTASLSQCRCLTVATKQDAVLSARRWDLTWSKSAKIGFSPA